MSPRKTPSAKQPKLTGLHTRKQSLATGKNIHIESTEGVSAGRDLISAIKRATVIDAYLQTISVKDRKRSKSKKPKPS